MAVIHTDLYSKELMRTVPITVLLPADKRDEKGNFLFQPPYRTLYLLHGIFGDNNDYLYGTDIFRLSNEYNLAVIMPSGENKFYVNHPGGGENYSNWIGKELVELTRRIFPLSNKREDTFLAGLSMGGFGTLANGLACPETFGKIAAFSAAIPHMIVKELKRDGYDSLLDSADYMEACLGRTLDEIEGSEIDLKRAAEKLIDDNRALPEIYMSCGTEDPLYPLSEVFAQLLSDLGYSVIWNPSSGNHDWDFWNKELKTVLKWFCPEQTKTGISSGSIRC